MIKLSQLKQIEQLKSKNKRIVLHFTAQWCPPCKLSKKIIESQLSQTPSHYVIADVDADKSQELLQMYKVEGIPTFILLGKNLNISEKVVGFNSEKIKSLFKKLRQQ